MVRVQTDDFNIQDEVKRLTQSRTDIGAIVSFIGLVRDFNDAPLLESMTLEHYPGMTKSALVDIKLQATNRWNLLGSTIIHRVGVLKPSDQIVLVLTASAHRQDAFDSASFIMDYLKTQAPFWKKEALLDGTSQWVDARASDDAALAKWQ